MFIVITEALYIIRLDLPPKSAFRAPSHRPDLRHRQVVGFVDNFKISRRGEGDLITLGT